MRLLLVFSVLPGIALAQQLPAQDRDITDTQIQSLQDQAADGQRKAQDVLRRIADKRAEVDLLAHELAARMPEYRAAQAQARAHRAANPPPGQ